ncbi:MAG: sigma-70 family RNA polymerase sigma factor, partial [Clostridia bacterium]|nr:sigma-70 family RNA polymerase sigma factor [Clostridia bacterium]
EEAESDTYVRTWNVIPPQIPLKLKVFLAKITRNISIDMYRKQHAERRGGQGCDNLLSELEEALPALAGGVDEMTPDKALDGSELTRAQNDFLASLDETKRVIFVKRYWYGASVADIASELSLTENNVATILFRLRASLKDFLEKEEIAI